MTNFQLRSAMRRLAAICLGFTLGVAIAQDKPTAPSNKLDEYQIGAQDLIELSVFQAPELSRTVRVNSRGLISLPLIGAVEAGGLSAQELEVAIAAKLAAGYLRDPQVSVFIKEFVSQRVTIEGAVKKTGVYPLKSSTTLLQALALAEGIDPLADEDEVKIFRENGAGQRQALSYNLKAIRAGQAEDPQIKGNDLVVVEKSATRTAIKNVTDTIRGFLSFGRAY